MNKKKLFVLLPAALLALAGCTPTDANSSTVESSVSSVQSSQTTSTTSSEEKPSSSTESSSSESPSESSSEVTKYNVEVNLGIQNGTVTPDKTKAAVGEDVTFTITPAEGYYLSEFKVNNEAKTVTGNTITVKMVEGGLRVAASFAQTKYDVNIPVGVEHGGVTADKTQAAVGEDVTFTVTAQEGYFIDSFKVNGEEVAVGKDGKATVKMVANGLTAAVTFTDVLKIADYTEDIISTIEAATDIKVALTADVTTAYIPLSKGKMSLDLGEHTLTATGNEKGCIVQVPTPAVGAEVAQEVIISNGSITYNGTYAQRSNIFEVTYAKSLTLDGVTLTDNGSLTGSSAGIQYSNATNINLKNSTLNFKTCFGVSSNNLEGKGATVVIDNTKITTTTADKDNTAFIGNIEGLTVEIKNGSSFKADRQAVIARTGNWTVSNTAFEITGDWLAANETNKATNQSYLEDAWKSGNEVPSAPFVVGDSVDDAYNVPITLNITDSVAVNAKGTAKIVICSDEKTKTTANFDAYTYAQMLDGFIADTGSTITKTNIKESTIDAVSKLTTTDSSNLYCVSGTIQSVSGSNVYLEDDDGKLLIAFNAYTGDVRYSKTDSITFKQDTSNCKKVDSTLIGKKVVVLGTYSYYNSTTPELTYCKVIVGAEPREDLTASVIYNEDYGTAELSKTTGIKYGEEITVTATPKTGYKVSKVTLTDVRGETEDITNSMKFVAGLQNTINVEFVSDGTPVAKTYNVAFNSTNDQKEISSYTETWKNISDGITYNIVNFNNNKHKDNWEYVRCGRKGNASVASIETTTPFSAAIEKTSITIDSITASSVNSIKLIVASDASFETEVETHDLNKSKGTQEIKISNKSKNNYFKYVFDCASASKNGIVQVSALTFTTVAE